MSAAASASEETTNVTGDIEQGRVLSIQSHVVSGYVGNKAAVFPLQLLGFDVDIVNSVHFSNHTGYLGKWEGDVLGGDQLRALLDGLLRNGLLGRTGHLLTGYIGSESFLRAVLDVIHTLRSIDPSVRYVCDPVLGDGGKFYVPQELVPLYKQLVIPAANVVTPNQFEVEQLTGIAISNLQDARKACEALHDMGPSLVLITSMILSSTKEIVILASQRGETEGDEVWRVDIPMIEGHYTGTGDLCAALFLGWTSKLLSSSDDHTLGDCLERVCNTMHAVISQTHQQQQPRRLVAHENINEAIQARELRLIQCRDVIERPPCRFQAHRLA